MEMWKSIPCALSELRLDHTLKCGQSFRWRETASGVWTGVIGRHVWKLKQDEELLYYMVFSKHHRIPDATNEHDKLQIKKEPKPTPDSDIKKEEPGSRLEDIVANSKQEVQDRSNFDRKPQIKTDAKDYGSTDSKLDKKDVLRFMDGELNQESCEVVLRDYFQLNVNLGALYKKWSKGDPNFKLISASFQGIRMLRQDPIENLFSFICSSNNNISRISSMVEKLCDNYGDEITDVDEKSYHAFPKISDLDDPSVEAKLREIGFGYRAKYIYKTANYICDNHDEDWLYSLRSIPYKDAKRELMKLCGVGGKVADCVCLMSMDKPGTIPVDTHVWQIASRHYLKKLQSRKSLTDKLYEEIGDCFRSLWGSYAGWAHSVLFAADLKHFKDTSRKDSKKDVTNLKRSIQTKNTKEAKHAKKK